MHGVSFPGTGLPVPDVSGRNVGRSNGEGSSPLSRDYVEIDDLLGGIRRIAKALGRRVGTDGDLAGLAALVELRNELDGAIIDAVAGLRHDECYPASWAEIAQALGVTRRAVIDRFGKVGGIRRPGGQPAGWR